MDVVVISGGSGFVGSHLVDLALARGLRVVVIDNLLTGHPRNLAQWADDNRLIVYHQDCAHPIELDLPVRYVLHFASPASPADYIRYPLETLSAGADGTRAMLELARAHNARFLLASTSEIYGDPLVHPQVESYFGNVNTIGPRSVYDEAKRFAESVTMAYHRTHAVNTGIVRLFNTYGPRMRLNDGRAIPNFVYQALTGQPLTLYGDGTMTRSFCYVSDTVDGIMRLVMSDIHEPVNIGNPGEYTILELAERILAATGSGSPLEYEPAMQDDPKVRRPDITRARTLLDWQPTIPLADGLLWTIEAFKRDMAATGTVEG
jgi:dTDP-glucose 4,6-dehydratase